MKKIIRKKSDSCPQWIMVGGILTDNSKTTTEPYYKGKRWYWVFPSEKETHLLSGHVVLNAKDFSEEEDYPRILFAKKEEEFVDDVPCILLEEID